MRRASFGKCWQRGLLAAALLLLAAAAGAAPAEGADGEAAQAVEAPSGMVFIPGGSFTMGREGYGDHSPPHELWIDAFFLDRREVSNAEYLAFCEATERGLPEFWGMDAYRSGPDYPDHPVVGVSWLDAQAYAAWKGCRLPTEAEWEYAARGGLIDKLYTHGDELDSTLYAPRGMTGTAAPSPVAQYPPNGFGLHDMTGNVVEWVADWYDDDYYASSPAANPPGPGSGKFKVIRGGGWHTGPSCSRVYHRTALQRNWRDFNVGFRCAKYIGDSTARRFEEILDQSGLEAARRELEAMRACKPGAYYVDEVELNTLGYQLLGDGEIDAAVTVFEVATTEFPQSYNAFDSLGEAYLAKGEREKAIENYRRSVELNPRNGGGWRQLEELGAK
jgi:iron(II)-dependent oxidoreductase